MNNKHAHMIDEDSVNIYSDKLESHIDLVVTIGGDGTIL